MVKAVLSHINYGKPPIKPTQWMLCDYAIALDLLFCAIALDLLFCAHNLHSKATLSSILYTTSFSDW